MQICVTAAAVSIIDVKTSISYRTGNRPALGDGCNTEQNSRGRAEGVRVKVGLSLNWSRLLKGRRGPVGPPMKAPPFPAAPQSMPHSCGHLISAPRSQIGQTHSRTHQVYP